MADTSHNSVDPNGRTAADGAAHAAEHAGEAMLKMLTTQDLADLLRCSPRTIYRLVDVGRIPSPCRLGSLVRWTSSAIEAWLAAGCPTCRQKGGR